MKDADIEQLAIDIVNDYAGAHFKELCRRWERCYDRESERIYKAGFASGLRIALKACQEEPSNHDDL